uniref:Chaperone CPN60 n=1 Tax=Amorphochlora amoebiformis TaxID=1561963 RepID=A0A0H5BM06_9EUKA|nr:chaperone CPN60 [Amorphochlora amoebiformis]|mmetsp:Transcript_29234/g.46627  ORF Transcript_29234/g.46627 Transcript_29234/m.46627 type:complete len:562 (+) Transcript_29234:2329-4014(+)
MQIIDNKLTCIIMSYKTIYYREIIIKKMQKGLRTTMKILSLTLGPRGKNVVLWDKSTNPVILNDGTSIVNKLNNIKFPEYVGQFVVKDIIHSVNDTVGDGTSTTGVLGSYLLIRGMDIINNGFEINQVFRGMLKSSNLILNRIHKAAWPIQNNKDILRIATNSAGGDAILGNLIIKAFKKVGTDGLISIEATDKKKSTLVVYGGLQLDRGFVSHKFINNFRNSSCEFNDPAILVTDYEINNVKDAVIILQKILEINKPLLLISDSINKKVLSTFITNTSSNKIQMCAVKIPSFGIYRKSILQDISIASGTKFLSKDGGISLSKLNLENFGSIKKCIVSENNCTIVTNNKYKNRINTRIKFLENMLSKTDSVFEIEHLSERIAKLSGGIAVINLGASTELELNDKKLRIEDAKNATFSSLTQGVITGASSSLLHYSKYIRAYTKLTKTIDESLGLELVSRAMVTPQASIVNNSGYDSAKIEKIIGHLPLEIGFDAENKSLSNLVKEGIVDPSLLVYNSITNARNVSQIILNTKAIISLSIPKKLLSKFSEIGDDHIPYLFNM